MKLRILYTVIPQVVEKSGFYVCFVLAGDGFPATHFAFPKNCSVRLRYRNRYRNRMGGHIDPDFDPDFDLAEG